jgi:peptidyl-prolyl cis-trans isomerase SurA
VALFFLRERDVPQGGDTGVPTLDYMTFALPGGDGALARIATEARTCDEVYAAARRGLAGSPQRQTLPVAQIPGGLASVLAGLDANEVGAAPGGGGVMLCARTLGINFDAARGEVRGALLNQQVGAQATQFLAELRARAIIQILQ